MSDAVPSIIPSPMPVRDFTCPYTWVFGTTPENTLNLAPDVDDERKEVE